MCGEKSTRDGALASGVASRASVQYMWPFRTTNLQLQNGLHFCGSSNFDDVLKGVGSTAVVKGVGFHMIKGVGFHVIMEILFDEVLQGLDTNSVFEVVGFVVILGCVDFASEFEFADANSVSLSLKGAVCSGVIIDLVATVFVKATCSVSNGPLTSTGPTWTASESGDSFSSLKIVRAKLFRLARLH